MAIPPRKWVGYAILLGGLSLLFDTYTFLRTNWSPLQVPMSVPDELALGYSLVVAGALVLTVPLLLRSVANYAPDASMKMGENLAHESIEVRRQKRLPLKSRITTLPNRGVVGGAVMLLLLVPMFLMVTGHSASRGFYLKLTPRVYAGPDPICIEGPIVVTIEQHGPGARLRLNDTDVSQSEFQTALLYRLARQANSDVFIEADNSVAVADVMNVIDIIQGIHANAVLLTPELKRKLADMCSAHRLS